LENVPGLLECDDGKAIRAIKQDFKGEINWSSVSYGLMNSKRLFN
jgi:site-specific DNA-cytosine methylase